MKIEPTVGRVIWVHRPNESLDVTQPETGQITYVHEDGTVNVVGFDRDGVSFRLRCATLVQEDEPKPDGDFVRWMPYQVGQAKAAQTPAPTPPDQLPATAPDIAPDIAPAVAAGTESTPAS